MIGRLYDRAVGAVLERVAKGYPERPIYRDEGKKLFTRWYLRGDRHDDQAGAHPWNLFLHRFHISDDAQLHNHPWDWAVSLVLTTGYVEERAAGDGVVRRRVGRLQLNTIRANDYHRIELDQGEAWTLFMVGKRVQRWGFLDTASGFFRFWDEEIHVCPQCRDQEHDGACCACGSTPDRRRFVRGGYGGLDEGMR